MSSLITGFIFSVMVTRKLQVAEYGLWSIISSIVAILCYPYLLYGYWVTRCVARNIENTVKTGLFLTFVFMLGITPIYLLVSLIYVNVLRSNVFPYFIGGLIYFYVIYMWYYLRTVVRGVAPQIWGYSLMIGEVSKVTLGYFLIVKWRMRLWGVITSLVISFMLMDIFSLLRLTSFGLISKSHKVDFNLIKKWFKAFWIPLIDMLSNTFLSSEQVVISTLTKSTVPSAFLQVGRITVLPISYGITLASGLYARLLKKVRVEDVSEVLRLVFVINNFIFVSIIILAQPILSILNPKYAPGFLIPTLLAIYSYLDVLIYVFNTSLIGMEKVDMKEEVSFADLAKSYLVKSPLIILLRNLFTLILASFFIFFKVFGSNPIDYALAMAISWVITSIPSLIIYLFLVFKKVGNLIPLREFFEAFFASLIVALYYYIFKVSQLRVVVFLRDFIVFLTHLVIAGLIYVCIMFIISKWFRGLVKQIVVNIRDLLSKF